MSDIERLTEYYEELFPTDDTQLNFFTSEISSENTTPKYLRIGCGTGLLENRLAKLNIDVTGIEAIKPFLDSASLRYRTPNMSIRFFQMYATEMGKFLGKGFYDCIACLDNRMIYVSEEDKLKQFFIDCKSLLRENGKLILELTNFLTYKNQKQFKIPARESIRAKLDNNFTFSNGIYKENEFLHNSSGKIFNIMDSIPVSLVTIDDIKNYASKAGFSSIKTYADYSKKPFANDSERLLCVIQ